MARSIDEVLGTFWDPLSAPDEDVRLGTTHGGGDDLEIAWVTGEHALAQRRTEEDDVRVHAEAGLSDET